MDTLNKTTKQGRITEVSCLETRSSIPTQRLPQQIASTKEGLITCFDNFAEILEGQNRNSNRNAVDVRPVHVPLNDNQFKLLQKAESDSKARRTLVDELDLINAEFDIQNNEFNITAPDGIRIAVDAEEVREFLHDNIDDSQLDFDELAEEESIFPIPQSENEDQDDADTIVGEDPMNDLLSSSTIISFKRKVNGGANMRSDQFLGKKGVAEMTPDELIRANPALHKMVMDLKKKTETPKRPVKNDRRVISAGTRECVTEELNDKMGNFAQDKSDGEQSKSNPRNNSANRQGINMKSPSDTTIYAPALKLTPIKSVGIDHQGLLVNNMEGLQNTKQTDPKTHESQSRQEQDIMNRISNFVEQVRFEVRGNNKVHDNPEPSTSRGGGSNANNLEQTDRVANNFVIEAEKFRAATELPRGRSPQIVPSQLNHNFAEQYPSADISTQLVLMRNTQINNRAPQSCA